MKKSKLAYTLFAAIMVGAAACLYAMAMRTKLDSFGLGLSHVLSAVTCLGLSIVCGFMAALTPGPDQTNDKL